MQKLIWLGLFSVVLGCSDGDDGDVPIPPRPASLDASAARPMVDADTPALAPYDGGTACAPIAVCSEGKPGLLYNVCVAGSVADATGSPSCLIDPNGSLYLVSLAPGQTVSKLGWTSGATLSTDDQQRCAQAIAALDADAAAPCSPS